MKNKKIDINKHVKIFGFLDKRSGVYVRQEEGYGSNVIPNKMVDNTLYFPIVGNMFFVSNHETYWRTNVVNKIVSRSETAEGYYEIEFETVSGSEYRWTFDPKQIN